MDTLGNENVEIKPAPAPEMEALQEQVDSLRHTVVSLLILVIILSGAFNLFLLRQVKFARTEANNLQQVVNEYNKNAPGANEFLNRLAEFSKKYPDFAPVLAKYGFKPIQATGAPPAVVTPGVPAVAPPVSPATAPRKK